MGGFKSALLGYRRADVDAALAARDAHISSLYEEVARAEQEGAGLSAMVIEREREIRILREQLDEANRRHDRSIVSLEAVAARLDEIQAQARGQATRIRMKALREAVELGRRAQELAEADPDSKVAGPEGQASAEDSADRRDGTFEGPLRLEIGPLGDFSQLVEIEDAIGRMGASEISVERFSEGRATLSMRLDEPVDLLRELEESAAMDFKVRRTADDGLILDVDEDAGPDQAAA